MTDVDLILQWMVAATVGLLLLARGQLTFFHPTSVYLLFHVIVFCVRPTMLHVYEFDLVWNYIGFDPTPQHLRTTLLLSSAGLILIAAVFMAACPFGGPWDYSDRTGLSSNQRRAFFMVAAFFGPLGLYSIRAADVQGERINGVYVMTGTSGYLNDLQQVLIPVTVIFPLACRWKWYGYIPLLIFLYYRASLGWARWTIVLPIFALMLLYLWDNRRRFPPLKYLLPVPLLLMLFANMGHDRMYFSNLVRGIETDRVTVQDSSRDVKDRFDTLDFANFDYLAFIVAKVPEESKTYTYGTQYLQLFTEPIPRKLWRSKPVGPPVVLVDLMDHGNFNGLTPSLVGDGWLSGGWLGAVVTMCLAGLGLGLLYNWFYRHQGDIFVAIVFIIMNSVMVQLFRDGGISIFKFLLFSLLPVFAWRMAWKVFFPEPPTHEWLDDEGDDDEEIDDESAESPWVRVERGRTR
jgi:hypothetical protein